MDLSSVRLIGCWHTFGIAGAALIKRRQQ